MDDLIFCISIVKLEEEKEERKKEKMGEKRDLGITWLLNFILA